MRSTTSDLEANIFLSLSRQAMQSGQMACFLPSQFRFTLPKAAHVVKKHLARVSDMLIFRQQGRRGVILEYYYILGFKGPTALSLCPVAIRITEKAKILTVLTGWFSSRQLRYWREHDIEDTCMDSARCTSFVWLQILLQPVWISFAVY